MVEPEANDVGPVGWQPGRSALAAVLVAIAVVLVTMACVALATYGRYVFPGLFPASFDKIDSFVEEFDPETLGPVVATGRYADGPGNATTHSVIVFGEASSLPPLGARLEEVGFEKVGSLVDDPVGYWGYQAGCGDQYLVGVEVIEPGDGVGLGDGERYVATGDSVVLHFETKDRTNCD